MNRIISTWYPQNLGEILGLSLWVGEEKDRLARVPHEVSPPVNIIQETKLFVNYNFNKKLHFSQAIYVFLKYMHNFGKHCIFYPKRM